MKSIFRNVFCASPFNYGCGLTNIIISFVASIIYCKKNNCDYLIVNDFFILDNIPNSEKDKPNLPASKVLDMQRMNKYLYENFQIELVDRHKLNYKIHKVFSVENNGQRLIDITRDVLDTNTIFIDAPGSHNIVFDYSLGQGRRIHRSQINIRGGEKFDFENVIKTADFPYIFITLGSLEPKLFDEILVNICYNEYYYEKTAAALKETTALNGGEKINVVHLRLENDVYFFANELKYTHAEYTQKLADLYIENIKANIDKNSTTILLSYDCENAVVDFMRDNGYKYIFIDKHENGRENNALVDFIAAQLCNGVFIGNYNLEKMRGSTYSYYIMRMMEKYSPAVKNILLYLDEAAATAAAEK